MTAPAPGDRSPPSRPTPPAPGATRAVAGFLDRMATLDDPAVFISVAADADLTRLAAQIDDRPGADVPLRGLVFAVKDNIDVAGLPTTAGCPAYAYTPARSAPVVDRLVAAGAVPVAKTNLDQFATGLVGTRSPYGTPRNPIDPALVPGGSSSGSAVAVADGLVDFALGTDTAGSGRVPAAMCGIHGIKPTRGRVSTVGVVPAVRTCDVVSVFAADLSLAGRVLEVMSAFDPDDAYARPVPRTPPGSGTGPEPRIGFVGPAALTALGVDGSVAAAYRATVDRLRPWAAAMIEIDMDPFLAAGDLLYGGPWVAERTAVVGPFIDAHPDAVDPTVAAIVATGRSFSAVDAHLAAYTMADLRRRAGRAFEVIDLLVTPTVPHHATLAEVAADPVGANSALGRFTTFANLLDLAAVSVTVPGSDRTGGVPPNVTLYGPAWSDEALLACATALVDPAGPAAAADTGGSVQAARTPPRTGPGTEAGVRLVVAGAHLKGQPLEHQLTDLGAVWEQTTRTAPTYRLYALAGTEPAKPGLVFDPTGWAVEVDVWRLSPDGLGRFLTTVPAPLALGTVDLADGSSATGFVCEPRALDGAHDVTELGGWRRYRASTG